MYKRGLPFLFAAAFLLASRSDTGDKNETKYVLLSSSHLAFATLDEISILWNFIEQKLLFDDIRNYIFNK